MRKQKLATFNIDPDIWERFKAKCLESGSNASAELVRFVTAAVDGESLTPPAAIDPIEIERAVETYLDKNLDKFLAKRLKRTVLIGEVEILDEDTPSEAGEEKAIDNSGVSDRESEPLPIIDYLEKHQSEEPEPIAPIVTVETYAICQCRDRAIVSFWTGGGWSEDFAAARVYPKEGSAKTQVVRLQKNNPGLEIRYNSIDRITEILNRSKAA